MLYGTTKEFLSVFGLASLADLPQRKEFATGGAAKSRRGGSPSKSSADSAATAPETIESGEPADGSTAAGPAAPDGSPDE